MEAEEGKGRKVEGCVDEREGIRTGRQCDSIVLIAVSRWHIRACCGGSGEEEGRKKGRVSLNAVSSLPER